MSESLARKVVADKEKGLTDEQIGAKYSVNLKFIEKAIVEKYGVNISDLKRPIKTSKQFVPRDDTLQSTTVWSFKSRGAWATHSGNYRGNWSPYIPRNVIKRYSEPGDLVLDYFCGAGTTGVECKLLDRNFIGIDINPDAIKLAKENVKFDFQGDLKAQQQRVIDFVKGDARNLDVIEDGSVDLICAHPPYSDIVQYTENDPADLSHLGVENFLNEMRKVALESFRVLKDGKKCAILIGDMRKHKHVVPLGFWTIKRFLDVGFRLKELVIKRQHNCKTTGFWYTNSIKFNFLLLAHEYLAIFEKSVGTTKQRRKYGKWKTDYEIVKPELESTTVWIFSPEDWLTKTLSNIVHRYNGQNYAVDGEGKHVNGPLDLAVYLNPANITKLLQKVKSDLKTDGVLAILCEDVRLRNGRVFSKAIQIERQMRKRNQFMIQEIIVISCENGATIQNENELTISHRYALIYRRAR